MPSDSTREPAPGRRDWLAITEAAIPTEDAVRWATQPSCGAVVSFLGTVRDHADGRDGVTALTYEAYVSEAERVLAAVAGEARARHPDIERIALLHRVGRLALGDVAVAVVVSSPHRDAAFGAARFAIDELKATVPIWKQEHWSGGDDWSPAAVPLRAVGSEPSVTGAGS